MKAYRPPDSYHPHAGESWESTEVESDSSCSISEMLLLVGARRGTILVDFSPTPEELEKMREDCFRDCMSVRRRPSRAEPPVGSTSSPLPPPSLSLTFPSSPPASPEPSHHMSFRAPPYHAKRARKAQMESSGSDSERARQYKRAKRPVLNSIQNTPTITSPSPSHPSPVARTAPSPVPALLPAPAPTPAPVLAPRKGRRTPEELQKSGKSKTHGPEDHSPPVCGFKDCDIPLPVENIAASREHITKHFSKKFSGTCLWEGCTRTYKNVGSAKRHFEGHLWTFMCPNPGCEGGPYCRPDSQKRHMETCEFAPRPADDGYAADGEN